MRKAIIIYIIGIITYWIGVFALFFTAKKNWDNIEEDLIHTTTRRSKASRILLLIVKSFIPVVNFSAGFGYISNPYYFIINYKRKGQKDEDYQDYYYYQ